MLRVLDLFAGIGGFSLGLEMTGGFETVAFCEIEKYPQEILKKNFPSVPIYEDVRELTADRLIRDGIGRIDVITGGYPCQPFSVAGKQKGEADDRHLWPFMLKIIAQVRPSWVICENVSGHIALGLDQVLFDLENEGYATRTFVVPACAVNAPHRRDRLWIVADTDKLTRGGGEVYRKSGDKGRAASKTRGEGLRSEDDDSHAHHPATRSQDVADSQSKRIQGHRTRGKQEPHTHEEKTLSLRGSKRPEASHWAVEPNVGRVADGVPRRVAKLKALGNAVVPQIPMMIGQAILDYENDN